MTRWQKISLLLLRLGLGWLFFYAGITKVLDPEWSAAGYLGAAKTFPAFYQWLASEGNLAWVNFLNMGGLTVVGVSLLTGTLVRPAAVGGAVLMLLYYFPVLEFPYIEHGYLVDEHILYALVFMLLAVFSAGTIWGLDGWLAKRFKKICDRYPILHLILG